MNKLDSLLGAKLEGDGPICLFDGPHQVWWIGSKEDSPFRCNAYLIVDDHHRVLFDPGSAHGHFPQVKARVSQICDPTTITHIVAHHQDPDVIGSLPQWLALCPEAVVICTPRTRVLLPFYGTPEHVNWLDVSPLDNTVLELDHGDLAFITSPFLHFPEAMVTFDETSGFLLSSDIGAAIDDDWKLVADDWEAHWRTMVPFHVFYMANNRALRGFCDKVTPFPIQAILPQHGSILPRNMVKQALDALRELPCGIDLLYPASNMESLLQGLLR